jgi:hypothetical protein
MEGDRLKAINKACDFWETDVRHGGLLREKCRALSCCRLTCSEATVLLNECMYAGGLFNERLGQLIEPKKSEIASRPCMRREPGPHLTAIRFH